MIVSRAIETATRNGLTTGEAPGSGVINGFVTGMWRRTWLDAASINRSASKFSTPGEYGSQKSSAKDISTATHSARHMAPSIAQGGKIVGADGGALRAEHPLGRVHAIG